MTGRCLMNEACLLVFEEKSVPVLKNLVCHTCGAAAQYGSTKNERVLCDRCCEPKDVELLFDPFRVKTLNTHQKVKHREARTQLRALLGKDNPWFKCTEGRFDDRVGYSHLLFFPFLYEDKNKLAERVKDWVPIHMLRHILDVYRQDNVLTF